MAIEYHEHVWLLVVTVMTVGFGDFTPQTGGGKVVTIFASICGLVWSATLIGVINNSIALSYYERIVISYLESHDINTKIRHLASSIIQLMWRLGRTKKFG